MNTLFHWPQSGLARPMQPDGTQNAGPCEETPRDSLILTGSGRTDGIGQWRLEVPTALCAFRLNKVDWVSMVATPSKHQDGDFFPPPDPSYVTTAWSTGFLGGLTLFVDSWGPQGQMKPSVEFSWHAVVLYPKREP